MREIVSAGLDAIPAMVAPVILIGGIVSGVATPTEVSSTAVIYALLLSVVVYRSLTGQRLWRVMVSTAAQAGMVLFITSTASTFSWSLTIAKMPQKIAALFTTLHGSATLFMLATIVTLVVMGALLEGLPALLIFGPLLLPMAAQFGIDPIQYGIVMIIAMGLGAFSPPIGVGMFVTCSICDTTMENASRHMIPYLIVVTHRPAAGRLRSLVQPGGAKDAEYDLKLLLRSRDRRAVPFPAGGIFELMLAALDHQR